MELKISIKTPEWDPNPQKSTTNNHNWRKCVIVEFPNCSFQWIPTYKHLVEIYQALQEAEQINKELVKEQ